MSATITPAEVDEARRRRTRRALVAVAAGLAPALVWLAAAAGGADLTVGFGDEPPAEVGLPAVLTVGLGAALAGWAALAVLERLTSRARAVWSALAVAVLAGSFVPVVMGDATAGTRAALAAMHVVLAVVLLTGLPAARRGR